MCMNMCVSNKAYVLEYVLYKICVHRTRYCTRPLILDSCGYEYLNLDQHKHTAKPDRFKAVCYNYYEAYDVIMATCIFMYKICNPPFYGSNKRIE